MVIPQADAFCFVFQDNRLISDLRAGPLLTAAQIKSEQWQIKQCLLIGQWQGNACYAVTIVPQSLDLMRYHCGHMLGALGRVSTELFQLLGRASQLLTWERDHAFCGRCAAPMTRADDDIVMSCSACDFRCYPRIAPCAIMLVTRGDQVLLARSAQFPDGFYSALAGFIEPGESAEACLIREVQEEVGLLVSNPRYFGSQPWAFPSQLMLGYFCDYESGDIVCQEDEILDAQWFSADNLPAIPPETAIAGQLIRHFFKQDN